MLTVEIDGEQITISSDPEVVAEIRSDEKAVKSLLSIIQTTLGDDDENKQLTTQEDVLCHSILENQRQSVSLSETQTSSEHEIDRSNGKRLVKTKKKALTEPQPLDEIKYKLKTDPRFIDIIKNLSLSFKDDGDEYHITTNNYNRIMGIMKEFGMAFAVRSSYQGAKKIRKKAGDVEMNKRILWSSSSLDFFGMPFKIHKTVIFQCSNAPQYYHSKLTPETRKRKRTKPSKKGDCAATMKVVHATVYPKFSLDLTDTVNVNDRKKAKMKQLRESLSISDVLTEDRYFIWFSKPEVHSHSVWATCSTQSLTTLLSQQGFNNVLVVSNTKSDAIEEESAEKTEESPLEEISVADPVKLSDSDEKNETDLPASTKSRISVADVKATAARILSRCNSLPSNCDVSKIFHNLKLAERQITRLVENSVQCTPQRGKSNSS